MMQANLSSLQCAANGFGSAQNLDPIHILVTLNQAYLEHLKVLLVSIHLNNQGERFVIHLMHRNISPESLVDLERFAKKLEFELKPIEVPDSLFEGAPITKRYPHEMYYRLLAHRFVSTPNQRIIYLDPDTLVINPLRPLWELDLEGCIFAAASHDSPLDIVDNVNNVRLNTTASYFNSGVLLIDLARAEAEVRAEDMFAYTAKYNEVLVLPDQDVMNALYGNRVLEIPELVWNYDARRYKPYFASSNGVTNEFWIMENTVVLHFCGKQKPWNASYPFRFGTLYRHYMRLTERLTEQP